MNIIRWAVGKIRSLLGLEQSIQELFNATIVTPQSVRALKTKWRNIAAGKPVPRIEKGKDKTAETSLKLANAVSKKIADRAALGSKIEIKGSPRADYINEQLIPVTEDMHSVAMDLLNYGEIILKPHLNDDGTLGASIIEDDCYFALGYNFKNDLIDVAFVQKADKGKYDYLLVERQIFNKIERTHTIEYHAFRQEKSENGFNLDGFSFDGLKGKEANIKDIPDWANLEKLTILNDVDKPLFVHIKTQVRADIGERPRRTGIPIFHEAIDTLADIEELEADIKHEYRMGKLKLQVAGHYLRKDEHGNYIFPDDGLYIVYDGADDFQAQTFAPDFRIEQYKARMNDLLRRFEQQCYMSYGEFSDNNVQVRTATEYESSKEELITTVSRVQRNTMQPAFEHLINSFGVLADVLRQFGFADVPPQGNIETVFEWNESYAINRKEEVAERRDLVGRQLMSDVQFLMYYHDISKEEAEIMAAEIRAYQNQLASEFQY